MKNLQDFPRIPLAVLPTPIQKLENISRLLNTNVYIKRDDLTGIGLGGNKVRKLEFLLADAKRKGAEVVFTTGGQEAGYDPHPHPEEEGCHRPQGQSASGVSHEYRCPLHGHQQL